MMRTKVLAAVAVAAVAFTGACGTSGDADSTTTTAATDLGGGVAVSDPWARATPPTSDVAAVYFRVDNSGGEDALVGASVGADVAGAVQIHVTGDGATSESTTAPAPDVHTEHSLGSGVNAVAAQYPEGVTTIPPTAPHGGVTGMTQVMRVDIPAGSTVAFEPGGNHLMLMDLVQPLVAGQSFAVQLQFERAGTQTITVDVRDD